MIAEGTKAAGSVNLAEEFKQMDANK